MLADRYGQRRVHAQLLQGAAVKIVVCMVALLCAMACVFMLSALVPVYLTNVLGLTLGQMSVVTSAIGFGGFFGQFGWPGLPDRFGRKPLAILGFAGATISGTAPSLRSVG